MVGWWMMFMEFLWFSGLASFGASVSGFSLFQKEAISFVTWFSYFLVFCGSVQHFCGIFHVGLKKFSQGEVFLWSWPMKLRGIIFWKNSSAVSAVVELMLCHFYEKLCKAYQVAHDCIPDVTPKFPQIFLVTFNRSFNFHNPNFKLNSAKSKSTLKTEKKNPLSKHQLWPK